MYIFVYIYILINIYIEKNCTEIKKYLYSGWSGL